jgi:hypothetical protein
VTGGAGRVQVVADCRLVLMGWGERLGQSRTKGGEGGQEGKIDGRMMSCVEVDDSSHQLGVTRLTTYRSHELTLSVGTLDDPFGSLYTGRKCSCPRLKACMYTESLPRVLSRKLGPVPVEFSSWIDLSSESFGFLNSDMTDTVETKIVKFVKLCISSMNATKK